MNGNRNYEGGRRPSSDRDGGRPRSGQGAGTGRDNRGGGRPPNRDQRQEQTELSESEIQQILAGDGETMVKVAERLGRAMEKFSRSQMRSFYGPVIRLRHETLGNPDRQKAAANARNRLHLLRARLAYTTKRDTGKEAGPLKAAMDKLVPKLQTFEQVDKLFDFIEALVAYHYSSSRQ